MRMAKNCARRNLFYRCLFVLEELQSHITMIAVVGYDDGSS